MYRIFDYAKLYLLFAALLVFHKAVAQNLVVNGGFEAYIACPVGGSLVTNATGWMNLNGTTPDFFHACGNVVPLYLSMNGTPKNFAGNEPPHSGNGYAGIWVSDIPKSAEYLATYLSRALIAGRKYYFEMYLSGGEAYSVCVTNKIAVHFAIGITPNKQMDRLLLEPHIIDTAQYINNLDGWVKYSGSYVATGGEQMLVIGVFDSVVSLKQVRPGISASAYYYIDDVSLIDSCGLNTPELLGNDTLICQAFSHTLDAFVPSATSYQWNTGAVTPSITVNQPGAYSVKVTRNGCVYVDTITIANNLSLSLGPDTLLCPGASLTIQPVAQPFLQARYTWSTGDTTPSIMVTDTGLYMLEMALNNCRVRDTIRVLPSGIPDAILGPDTSVCINKLFVLDATTPGIGSYQWSTGEITPDITTDSSGIYWVELSNPACTVRDSVYLNLHQIPFIYLGADSFFCSGDSVLLNAQVEEGITYRWQDGTSHPEYVVKEEGVYRVKVETAFCAASDSISLMRKGPVAVSLGADTFICEGTTQQLKAGREFAKYLWSTGSVEETTEVHTPGVYWLVVTDPAGCTGSDTIRFTQVPSPVIAWGNAVKKCEPDFMLDPGTFEQYVWQDGYVAPAYHVTDYGVYRVRVTNRYHCTSESSLEVINGCPPKVFVPDAFSPNNDGVNDFFKLVFSNVRAAQFFIYNRWGQLLFSGDQWQEWDGTYQDQPVICDVYVYRVTYISLDGVAGVLTGNVTLLR